MKISRDWAATRTTFSFSLRVRLTPSSAAVPSSPFKLSSAAKTEGGGKSKRAEVAEWIKARLGQVQSLTYHINFVSKEGANMLDGPFFRMSRLIWRLSFRYAKGRSSWHTGLVHTARDCNHGLLSVISHRPAAIAEAVYPDGAWYVTSLPLSYFVTDSAQGLCNRQFQPLSKKDGSIAVWWCIALSR